MAKLKLLEDKVAIVTGAGSGIGYSIASEFAKEGAKVVLACRAEKGEIALARIKEETAGAEILLVPTDVSKEEDILNLVAQTVKVFGQVDILVNNAARILQRPAVEMTTEEYEVLMRNNATSVVISCREVAKQMIRQKRGGKIVNISSIHAMISEPNCSAYTAAKGAMEAFSRTLATELAPYKINVNCIEPGATYSELTTPMYTKSVVEALYKRVPMKEIAQPEWIARGVVFLASDESRYMTGEVLVMDGGYRMDGSLPDATYWEE
ncbi:MAG: SDR family oxidoreductase [Lentimicrobiaceae bacterium]|nr:SDR family oxidoreductase [Lentimicrobiaceae bacterium]